MYSSFLSIYVLSHCWHRFHDVSGALDKSNTTTESEVCDGHWELALLLQVRQPIKAADLVHAVTFLFLSVPLNLKIA